MDTCVFMHHSTYEGEFSSSSYESKDQTQVYHVRQYIILPTKPSHWLLKVLNEWLLILLFYHFVYIMTEINN